MTGPQEAGATGLKRLIMITKPASPAAEAYRTLRANIQLGRAGPPTCAS